MARQLFPTSMASAISLAILVWPPQVWNKAGVPYATPWVYRKDGQPMPFQSGSTQSPRCPVSDWTKRLVGNDIERSWLADQSSTKSLAVRFQAFRTDY